MKVNICQQMKLSSQKWASEKWFVIEDESDRPNGGATTRYMGADGEFYPSMVGGRYFDTYEQVEALAKSLGYEVVEEEIYDLGVK